MLAGWRLLGRFTTCRPALPLSEAPATLSHPCMALTPKQLRFVAEYLVDLNATQAAVRAGYSKRTANEQGARLLANASVASAVKLGTARQLERIDLTAEMVKDRLRQLAFQDIRKLFTEKGKLRPLHELDAETAAMVAGVEVIKKNAEAGDGIIDTVHKVKIVDPVKPLEMLAKHFGLLVEKVEHSGSLAIQWLSPE
jgi:phage terminase small subunit